MAYPGSVILLGGTESVSRLVQWLAIGRAWIWRKCSKKRRPQTRSPRLFLIPHRSRKFTAQNIALIEYSRYPLFDYGTCGLTYVRLHNELCSICSNSWSMIFWIRTVSLWRWASSPAHSNHGLSWRSLPGESFSSTACGTYSWISGVVFIKTATSLQTLLPLRLQLPWAMTKSPARCARDSRRHLCRTLHAADRRRR